MSGGHIGVDSAKASSEESIGCIVRRVFRESRQGGGRAARALKDAENIVHVYDSSSVDLLLARCRLQAAVETLLSNSSISGSVSSQATSLDQFFCVSLDALQAALPGTQSSPECGLFCLQLAWALDLQKSKDLKTVARSIWTQPVAAHDFAEFQEDFDQQFLCRPPADAAAWAMSEAVQLYGQLHENLGDMGNAFPHSGRGGQLKLSITGQAKFVMRARKTALLTNELRAQWDQKETSGFFAQLSIASQAILCENVRIL